MFRTPVRFIPSVLGISLLCCGATFAQRQVAGHNRLGGEKQWVTEAVEASGVQFRTFDSAAAGGPVSYHVYLPDEYEAEPERRFPVLYWLHGSLGGLRGISPLSAHFGEAMRDGRIPPMLIVFANGLRLRMWVDSKDGSTPMENITVGELIPEIDASFRTIATRECRIVEGFSMGGYGAMRFGLKYPGIFGAASSLSGGPLQQGFTHSPRVDPIRREMMLRIVFGGDHDYYRAQSPWALAEQHAAEEREDLLLRAVIGEEDEMLAVAREFDAHLTALAIEHTFTVLPGIGHDTRDVLQGLGEAGWAFYREAFAAMSADMPAD